MFTRCLGWMMLVLLLAPNVTRADMQIVSVSRAVMYRTAYTSLGSFSDSASGEIGVGTFGRVRYEASQNSIVNSQGLVFSGTVRGTWIGGASGLAGELRSSAIMDFDVTQLSTVYSRWGSVGNSSTVYLTDSAGIRWDILDNPPLSLPAGRYRLSAFAGENVFFGQTSSGSLDGVFYVPGPCPVLATAVSAVLFFRRPRRG